MLTLLVALGVVAAGATPALADAREGYLALGDSVPFGFDPLVNPADASNFVGYPQLAASQLGLDLTNASCPGEASGGFISASGTDNSCRPYRAAFPLHTTYTDTQLAFALSYLYDNPRPRLISLTLGIEDLFACEKSTADRCAAPHEFVAALSSYERNLKAILSAIRLRYRGDLVVFTNYSTNYADRTLTLPIDLLNSFTTRMAAEYRARVADGFAAFHRRAVLTGGDSCAAGLLIRLPTGGCDVHPSPSGAALLATTLERAVGGAAQAA